MNHNDHRENVYLSELALAFSDVYPHHVKIIDAVNAGESYRVAAKPFGLSAQRARQIYLNAVRIGRGVCSRNRRYPELLLCGLPLKTTNPMPTFQKIQNNPSPQPPNTVAELLTDAQAAELLSVEPRTLRLWRNTRGLPFIRITSKVIRYRRSDVDAWLSRRRVVVGV